MYKRQRDFRGVNPNAFDGRGNYALGIKEQIIFPEIEYDKVDKVRGIDVYKRQLIDIMTPTQKTVDALSRLEMPAGVYIDIKMKNK